MVSGNNRWLQLPRLSFSWPLWWWKAHSHPPYYLLFTKNIMWIIRRKKNNASCLLSWDLVTGWTRITLEWPPISWRRCSSPCTIQYVDSVTCCDSCAWRPSRTQWRRGRTHSARDKSADRACKKYILPRPMFTAFPDLLSCSYFSFTWNTELLWIL